jgi:MarR-like DNA-binding transcriptional regulator SgrR of sgrS sRNA
VKAIEAKDPSTVVFKMKEPVGKSQLLHKLTEPMYGVVFTNEQGDLDLSKSSGPYSLASSSKEELKLIRNPHWFNAEPGMADLVYIRQPKDLGNSDQDGFAKDEWPNIVASSSLMPKALEEKYAQQKFSRWNRNLDRIFFFVPSQPLANPEGRKLFRALNEKLDRKLLTQGLSGFQLSHQFFPPGYVISDPDFEQPKGRNAIPESFKAKPLQFLAAVGRLGETLKDNISEAVEKLTGHKPKFIMVPLNEFDKARADGKYDILIATIPVNDPNTEGAVSFIFGMNPPLIANSGEGAGDFRARTIAARDWEVSKRNAEYRKVFTQAVIDGCLLPLFHFSSIVVAREGIDLSKVPTTDETVAFSKVRFK